MKHLVLAGGVALNCVANGRLLREGPFDDIWIQPAAGDAGGALGAALFVWHQLLEKPRHADGRDSQKGSLLGPAFRRPRSAAVPRRRRARSTTASANEAELLDDVAELLDRGEVVGWFQGRMEFGPRALGGAQHPRRSALAEDAGDDEPEDQVPRELPAVRARACSQEHAHEWFDLEPGQESPYMLLVAPVLDERRSAGRRRAARDDGDRSRPAQRVNVVALDGAGRHARRLQRPDPDRRRGRNPRFYRAC